MTRELIRIGQDWLTGPTIKEKYLTAASCDRVRERQILPF